MYPPPLSQKPKNHRGEIPPPPPHPILDKNSSIRIGGQGVNVQTHPDKNSRPNYMLNVQTRKDKKKITLHLIDGFLEFQAVCILSSYCMSSTPVSLNCFTSFKYSGIFRNFSIPSNSSINNLQINKCIFMIYNVKFQTLIIFNLKENFLYFL